MPHPPPEPSPYPGETRRQSVQRKLPYYLLGMAIGCVLVGLIVMVKRMTPKPIDPARAAPNAAVQPSATQP